MEIWIDDYHLHSTSQPLHTVVERPVQGLEGGAPRVSVYTNPGEAGQTVSQVFAGSSLITLPGTIRSIHGSSNQERLDDYATARRALLDAIRFEYDSTGRIQPRTLKVTMPDGSLYQATVYRHNWSAPLEHSAWGTFLLELLNPSGAIESQSETTLTINLPRPGGVVYPVVYPIVYGATEGGSGTATNYGDASVKPVIALYGPMENPVISNDTVGRAMRLNLDIPSGRRVVIDMGRPSIMEGSLTDTPTINRQDAKATGSSFWRLAPGANSIRLRATTYDVGYATMTFRSAFTSI